MNSVQLIGNLVRDPELRYSTGQNPVAICRFTIAVNDGFGDKQKTSFIRIVTFNKQAENCEKFLAKGRKVGVTGRVQTGSFTDKEGCKVYTTDVIAQQVDFLGGGKSSGKPDAPADNGETSPAEDYPPEEGFFVPSDDDYDIPF